MPTWSEIYAWERDVDEPAMMIIDKTKELYEEKQEEVLQQIKKAETMLWDALKEWDEFLSGTELDDIVDVKKKGFEYDWKVLESLEDDLEQIKERIE